MKRFAITLIGVLGIYWVQAQDGRHISLNFDLEKNAWAIDGGNSVNKGINFVDLQYFHYSNLFFDNSLFDVNISGFLSSIQGNNYQYSSDDSLQITNTNIVSLNLYHFLNDGSFRYGFVWGIDFMAKYLSTGAEPGGWEADKDHGSITGLGIPLGIGAETSLLNDLLYIDGKLAYYVVYNSQYALGGKTFQSTGIQSKVRARYYINDLFFASGQIFYENLSFSPSQDTSTDPSGRTTTTRLMLGIGVQF